MYRKFNKILIVFQKFRFCTLLDGNVNKTDVHFVNSKLKSLNLQKELMKIQSKINEGGGERARHRHVHQHNKLLVEDRLRLLLDEGGWLEIGRHAGWGLEYGDVPRAGAVTGLGRICGRLCAVLASDATVKGGAVYPVLIDKQLRLMALASALRVPLVLVVDSGGAYLPLQSEIFPDRDHGGRIFFSQAQLQSRGIPVISLVCGSCTAGGAYIPTMSSENGMIDKSSFIFLGGPPLVKAATGEIVSAEHLGGASLHTKVSGCSDYIFNSEYNGFLSVRNTISYFPEQTICSNYLDDIVDTLYSSSDLDGFLLNSENFNMNSRVIMNQILARILDGSCLHEYKLQYGTNLITGFGRISGFSVGVLACHGPLSEKDCIKGSNFIQLCGHRNITIISFIHTVENSLFSHEEKFNDIDCSIIKAKSSMMRSMASRNCKLITTVIGDAVGLDYVCLGGRSMEPDFLFSWTNSRFGWTEEDLKDAKNSSVFKSAGKMAIDEIVNPCDSRTILTKSLEILHTESNLLPKANCQPIYRF